MPQPSSNLHDEIVRVVAELDGITGEMSNGRPSQTRHDGHVDQVVKLGERLIQAARGPGRPVNPPLGRVAGGYAW